MSTALCLAAVDGSTNGVEMRGARSVGSVDGWWALEALGAWCWVYETGAAWAIGGLSRPAAARVYAARLLDRQTGGECTSIGRAAPRR